MAQVTSPLYVFMCIILIMILGLKASTGARLSLRSGGRGGVYRVAHFKHGLIASSNITFSVR